MCLGIPGRIVDIRDEDGARMARMDFDGIVKDVCLEYLPQLEVGDYAIVHVGFAITQLDEDSARESLELMRQQGVLEEELDPDAAVRAASWTEPTVAPAVEPPRAAPPPRGAPS